MKPILKYSLLTVVLLLLYSCSKEIDSSKIQIRNEIAYEVGIETPFTGRVVDETDSYYEVNYVNGKMDGVSKYYELMGRGKAQKAEANYKNGKKEGILITYYKNDAKSTEAYYISGVSHGLSTKYFENGQRKEAVNYKDGQKDGILKGWYKNGQKWIVVNYKNGRCEGIETTWYENGQRWKERTFKDGNLISVEAWDNNGIKLND